MHRNIRKNPWKQSKQPSRWRCSTKISRLSRSTYCGALLQQEGGLIPQLLQKMGRAAGEPGGGGLEGGAQSCRRVTGSGREADKYYIAREVDQVFTGG